MLLSVNKMRLEEGRLGILSVGIQPGDRNHTSCLNRGNRM